MTKPDNVVEAQHDETEPVPLVVNEAAPGNLGVGDYVFASRWSDCDPCDPWAVGHVSEIGLGFVVVGEVSARRFPKAMRISLKQGQRIIAAYARLAAEPATWQQPIDYQVIADIFDVSRPSGLADHPGK